MQLQKRFGQEQDCTIAKDMKIKELDEKIGELDQEVSKLKTQAVQVACQAIPESPTKGNGEKEEVKARILELQSELEGERKRNVKDKQLLTTELESLKEKLKDLEPKNKTNALKISEYTRMMKLGLFKNPSLNPVVNSNIEKKKTVLTARMELQKKYTYRSPLRRSVLYYG